MSAIRNLFAKIRNFKIRNIYKKPNSDVEPKNSASEQKLIDQHKRLLLICKVIYDPVWYFSLMSTSFVYSILKVSESHTGIFLTSGLYIVNIWYAMDILALLGCKYLTDSYLAHLNPSHRPICLIMFEIISVLPIAYLAQRFFAVKEVLYMYLQSLDALKLARIIYFFTFNQQRIDLGFFIRLFKLISTLFVIIFVGLSAVLLLSGLHKIFVTSRMPSVNLITVIRFTSIVTTWGFPTLQEYKNRLYIVYFAIIYTAISLFLIIGFLLASSTYDYILANQDKYNYKNKINLLQNLMRINTVKKHVQKLVFAFYGVLWAKQHGYSYTPEIFDVIPIGMQTDILLDVYCAALKHSPLFRNSDIGLARYLTFRMQHKFLGPGDIIYRKGAPKDKMIYVTAGIVQIISVQDEQTPILSLSAGTCLGEASLLVSQRCSTTVRCKSYVEIQFLRRKDFIHSSVLYVDKYRKLFEQVRQRYVDARRLHTLALVYNRRHQKNDYYTIIWLKDILQNIMDKAGSTVKNMFVIYELNLDKMSQLMFTTKFIDALVIADEREYSDDTEFLKTTFPYILHPNSIMAGVWEVIVILESIYFLFALPNYLYYQEDEVPKLIMLTYRIVSYSWFLDLGVQLSTAIITKDEAHTTFKAIASYRFKSSGFICDIIAALPLEMLTVITIKDSFGFNTSIMRVNRMLKVWRVFKMFRTWVGKLHVNFVHLVYVRFTSILIYTIYLTDCFLYASVCKYPPYVCNYAENYYTIFSAIQIVTGVGMLGPHDRQHHQNLIYFIAILTGFMCFVVMCVYFIAADVLTNTHVTALEKMIVELKSVFQIYQMPEEYSQRIYSYVNTHFGFNRGLQLLSSVSVIKDLSENLRYCLRENTYAMILKKSKLFQDLPEYVLMDLCTYIRYTILPSNEVVCYAGDYADALFIINKGVCMVIGTQKSMMSDGSVLNPLAFIYQLPIARTCLTKTCVYLLYLKYDDFRRILLKYPECVAQFGSEPHCKTFFTNEVREYIRMDTSVHKVIMEQPWSFHRFKKLPPDSKAEFDYFNPFDDLFHLSFIRYFLLRTTINPVGNFYVTYEVMKSIMIIISATLHSTYYVIVSENAYWKYSLLALDVSEIVDIYIRLHLCYYNDLGIFVKHPLSTAAHYLAHNFWIDFFSCLPLQLLVDVQSDTPSTRIMFLHMNRLLQLYRYFAITNYLSSRHFKPKSKFYSFRMLPMIPLASTLVGSFILSNYCVISDRIVHKSAAMKKMFTDGLHCKLDIWLVKSQFLKPLSPLRAQLYSMYMITGCITNIGSQGFEVQNTKSGLVIALLSIFGVYFTIRLLLKIVVHNLSTSDVLSMYQASLFNLKKYMKLNKVRSKLQQLIVDHYDARWNRQRGKNVVHLMKNFHYAIKQDILYYIYGIPILENSVFPMEGMKFVRNLMMYMSHETFMERANIVRVNDINSQIHVIYRGTVDVIAVDGTRLETLEVSAIFGNIDGLPYVRQKMNFVARSVVEVLSVESTVFFKVLNDHPHLKSIFTLATQRFVHYFPSKRQQEPKTYGTFYYDEKFEGLCSKLKNVLESKVFYPDTKFIRNWQLFNVLFAYISLVLYMYQVSLSEFNTYFVALQYFCDFIYILNFYVRVHLAYEDQSGILVTNLRMIRAYRKKNKFSYCMYVFGTVPLDAILFIVPTDYEVKSALFKVFRCNRLQRLQSIVNYFETYKQKINVKIELLQISSLIMKLVSVAVFSSCFIIWVSSFSVPNLSQTVPMNLHKLSGFTKLKIELMYFMNMVCLITRIAQKYFFPNSAIMILIYNVLMSVCPFIWSLLISQACVMVFKRQYLKTLFRNKTDKLLYFAKNEKISDSIMSRLQRYLDMLWLKYEGFFRPYLLTAAPLYVQEAIYSGQYMKYINQHEIFRKCHVDFKRQLVCKLKADMYYPDDYITFKDFHDNSVYVICKGCVLVIEENERGVKTIVSKLLANQWFGSLEFVKQLTVQKYTYRSSSYSTVLSLKYEDWKYLLDFFPATKSIIIQGINEQQEELEPAAE